MVFELDHPSNLVLIAKCGTLPRRRLDACHSSNNWDQIASSGGLQTLAADPFAVWAIDAVVGSSNIYSMTENGIEWSRTYSGSVTCNVPPPYGQQICPTFHHSASAQICSKIKCGATANATPWNNSGSWIVTPKVHTNDGWDCLLNEDPTSDCAVYENVGEMTCSGGGSNQDNTLKWVAGDSIAVLDYSYNASSSGPIGASTSPTTGYYLGQVDNVVHEGCAVSDPVPVCPASSPITITNRVEWYGGLDYEGTAYARWHNLQTASVLGYDAPYLVHGFYLAQEQSDGSLTNVPSFGGFLGPQDFLRGDAEAATACE